LATALAFVGCKKVEEINAELTNGELIQKSFHGEPMLSFKDFDELYDVLNKTYSYTLEELEKYEESIGFNSFGKLADQAMRPILNDVQNKKLTAGEVPQVLSRNSDFLQMADKNGESFCETKYYLSPFIYVMNRNGMFQVGKTCFKVFEGGHIYCDAEYYDELLNLTEDDFTKALSGTDVLLGIGDGNIGTFPYTPDGGGGSGSGGGSGNGYGQTYEKYAKNADDDERVYVRISYGEGMRRMVAGCLRIEGGYLEAKTWGKHKCLAIWWNSHRTHSQNISATLYVHGSSVSGNTSGTNLGYKVEGTLCSFTKTFPQGVTQPTIYISWLSGWGKVPAVTYDIP
jgi:hypothetical protein